MLENREQQVDFLTDYLNYVTYARFVAVVREKKSLFGYLGCVNMDCVTRRVHEDSVGKTEKMSF